MLLFFLIIPLKKKVKISIQYYLHNHRPLNINTQSEDHQSGTNVLYSIYKNKIQFLLRGSTIIFTISEGVRQRKSLGNAAL